MYEALKYEAFNFLCDCDFGYILVNVHINTVLAY
jgi:hypothetical protein